jgi:glycosyltransferase involved in cell wall biosynthesis
MKVPVSILIPIKNEAANLRRCLAAVTWADEIFVVDSNSTDGSQAIVEEIQKAEIRKVENGNGERKAKTRHLTPTLSPVEAEREGPSIKLVQFQFNGTWPKKKNWALENLPFKHEWVFILDADEVMPPEAEAEFRELVTGKAESRKQKAESGEMAREDARPTEGSGGHVAEVSDQKSATGSLTSDLRSPTSGLASSPAGYWINRRFMFMGKWLRHAYYPNWNLRLFKHKLGRYEKLTDVDTASGDNEVHEHVVVQGQTGKLQCEMDHYAFPSVDVFVEKHNRYSNWEARVALDKFLKGSGESLQSKEVGMLRRLKQLSQRLPFRPLQRFLYVYLWQKGFLDGKEGYHFARLHALYEYLCVVKTIELKQMKTQKNNGATFKV